MEYKELVKKEEYYKAGLYNAKLFDHKSEEITLWEELLIGVQNEIKEILEEIHERR